MIKKHLGLEASEPREEGQRLSGGHPAQEDVELRAVAKPAPGADVLRETHAVKEGVPEVRHQVADQQLEHSGLAGSVHTQ